MNIIDRLISEAIAAGGDAIEVEHKDGYEEVYPVKGDFGTSIGFALASSSQEAKSLRQALYRVAKKSLRLKVGGRDYEVRCRIYETFGEDAFRLEWKSINKPMRSQFGAHRARSRPGNAGN